MKPRSAINSVRMTRFGSTEYARVAYYLREPRPRQRRSYVTYIASVFELDDAEQSVTFQDECLLPVIDRDRVKVLLLFSNAHPESIANGMFHTAETGVANLWGDLISAGFFSADYGILNDPDAPREVCLSVKYDSPFSLAFGCYWSFPTFHPKHLRQLFHPDVEPPGFRDTDARLRRIVKEWRPQAIISFNGEVFGCLTGTSIRGYTARLREGVLERSYRCDQVSCRLFQAFPAAWRWDSDAERLRRQSLKRIAKLLVPGIAG